MQARRDQRSSGSLTTTDKKLAPAVVEGKMVYRLASLLWPAQSDNPQMFTCETEINIRTGTGQGSRVHRDGESEHEFRNLGKSDELRPPTGKDYSVLSCAAAHI